MPIRTVSAALRTSAATGLLVLVGLAWPSIALGQGSHGAGPGIQSPTEEVAGRTVSAPEQAPMAVIPSAPAAAPAAVAPPVAETAPRVVAPPLAEQPPSSVARPPEAGPVEQVASRPAVRPGPGLEMARVLPKAGEGPGDAAGVWPPIALALAAALCAALGLVWPRLRRQGTSIR